MDFTYTVIDDFEGAGQKIPEIIAHNAFFIDCSYMHNDFYQIIYDLALIIKEENYGLFVLARHRLNKALVFVRDSLNACDYVPEIDLVVKD